MVGIRLASPQLFLVSSSLSLLSLHFLLSFSLFEYTNSLYLALSAVYCIFDYFTSTNKAIPAFLVDRRALLASSLLSLSLLLSYEAYDIGSFYRWQSILLSAPLLSDGKLRLLTSCAATSGFLSFHLISNEDNPIDTPLFLSWLSSDLRSIISCCSLICATVLLSREKIEQETLAHYLFSAILISTAMREFLWPEMRYASIYYSILSVPSFVFLLIFTTVSVPISIRSYGHQLMIYDRPLPHVFIGFFICRIILLLVSRVCLIASDESHFLPSLPSIFLAGIALFCSHRIWISMYRNKKNDELLA